MSCRRGGRLIYRNSSALAVQTFLYRPIEGDWPYLWLDATYVKARRDHHSVAVIVAVAVNTDGRREVLGMTIGNS